MTHELLEWGIKSRFHQNTEDALDARDINSRGAIDVVDAIEDTDAIVGKNAIRNIIKRFVPQIYRLIDHNSIYGSGEVDW